MANFDIANIAVQMVCPNNRVQIDEAGLPSVLVYIPAFKNSDVLTGGDDNTHPAFIVNGEEIQGFYYSKYENVVHNGMAYSLPGIDPATATSAPYARSYCEAKGSGWHLSTAAEWAAIALWCKKNGFLPYGNTWMGKDPRENTYKAVKTSTYSNADTTGRVATGTGPLTWSHDGTAAGIFDLCGNVEEIQAGMRLVCGELQILANNDAADPSNSQDDTSACWKAINASTGALVEPECSYGIDASVAPLSGNTIRLDYVNSTWTYRTVIGSSETTRRSCTFASVTCDSSIVEAAQVLLRALALLPDTGEIGYEDSMFSLNNRSSIRQFYRGGGYTSSATGGRLFNISNVNLNTHACGFRCAYIPELEKEV